nr:MAG TPA: hypothetical protein [Caudoviricetes sp.]
MEAAVWNIASRMRSLSPLRYAVLIFSDFTRRRGDGVSSVTSFKAMSHLRARLFNVVKKVSFNGVQYRWVIVESLGEIFRFAVVGRDSTGGGPCPPVTTGCGGRCPPPVGSVDVCVAPRCPWTGCSVCR